MRYLTHARKVIRVQEVHAEQNDEESEDVVEQFKEFLDQVSPEDFAAGDS